MVLLFMGISKSEQDRGRLSDDVKAGLEMIKKRGKAEIGEKQWLMFGNLY